MKNTFAFLLVLLSCATTVAQKRPKYEDELPKILKLPSAGIPASLKIYQRENPEYVSIDFQLGLVYFDRYQQSDILTEYAYKAGNARNALGYFQKAKVNISERDVSKNEDHYFNFGRYDSKGKLVVQYDTIRSFLDTHIPELELFIEHAPVIQSEFTQGFSHYDLAHKLFTGLIGNYRTYNELLLMYDEKMESVFSQIQKEYASSLQHFAAYRQAIKTYPIPYDQQLKISSLDVYRLDGLSAEINFLVPEIEIWDYSKWVDDTRAQLQSQVNSLKTDLSAEQIRINQALASVQQGNGPEPYAPLEISKELLFLLRKYDHSSAIEMLFQYQEAKHEILYNDFLLAQLAQGENMDTDRKLYLNGQMLHRLREADTLLLQAAFRNSTLNYQKYAEFFDTHYAGKSGVLNYVSGERTSNNSVFDKYVADIRKSMVDVLSRQPEVVSGKYRNFTIPLQVSPAGDSLPSGLITTARLENFDGSAFVGGVYKNEKSGQLSSYVAGVLANGKIAWFKEYRLSNQDGQATDTRLAAMQRVPGGCAFILNGSTAGTPQLNRLMIVDQSGEEKLARDIELTQYPRVLAYNERTNSFFIVFKGNTPRKHINDASSLTFARYNILGELAWQQSTDCTGDVVDVTVVSDGYLVSGNFSQLRDLNGQVVRTPSARQSQLYLTKIDEGGRIVSINTFPLSGSYSINNVFKASTDCIGFLGKTGQYDEERIVSAQESDVFLILNSHSQVIYKTGN